MTVKESVQNEIKHIHEEYDKEGGKSIKPSFNYIVTVDSSDDFSLLIHCQRQKI